MSIIRSCFIGLEVSKYALIRILLMWLVAGVLVVSVFENFPNKNLGKLFCVLFCYH